jgi:hypothetical protein
MHVKLCIPTSSMKVTLKSKIRVRETVWMVEYVPEHVRTGTQLRTEGLHSTAASLPMLLRKVWSEVGVWAFWKKEVPVEYVSQASSVTAPQVVNQGRKNRPANGRAMVHCTAPLRLTIDMSHYEELRPVA